MGITADITADWHAALAALAWQVELGADEAICDAPTSAYDLPERPAWQARAPASSADASAALAAPKSAPVAAAPKPAVPAPELALAAATALAAHCADLASLDAAASGFEHCDMRRGARGVACAAGHPSADLLVICDPPSNEAERLGQAFTEDEALLFGRIFAAIGRSLDAPAPEAALHLAPALPWPLRGPLDSGAQALAMMRPFILRRIDLMRPKRVVAMGHFALEAVLQMTSMAGARGQWHQLGAGLPSVLAMQSPASLLKNPSAKRGAWADALALKAALSQG